MFLNVPTILVWFKNKITVNVKKAVFIHPNISKGHILEFWDLNIAILISI